MRALVLAIIVAGCASMDQTQQNTWVREPDYYSITVDGQRSPRYSRVDEYTEYGANALGAQARISDAYASALHAPPPQTPAIFFHAELPPGVTIEGRTVKVDPRAPFEPIATYQLGYVLASAPQETEIVDDLHRLANVTGADAVVVIVGHVGAADPRVKLVSGFVLRQRRVEPVQAPVKRTTAQLDYRATGDGCPSAADVRSAIAKRLGYSPWESGARTLHAEVAPSGRGFAASIRVGEGTPRTLSASTCGRVTDALVSVVAIQLD